MPVSSMSDKIRKNIESNPRFDQNRNFGDEIRLMNFGFVSYFQIVSTAFDVDSCDKTFISLCFFDKSENEYEKFTQITIIELFDILIGIFINLIQVHDKL